MLAKQLKKRSARKFVRELHGNLGLESFRVGILKRAVDSPDRHNDESGKGASTYGRVILEGGLLHT